MDDSFENNKNYTKMNKNLEQSSSIVIKILKQLFTSNFIGKFLLKINYEYFSKTHL